MQPRTDIWFFSGFFLLLFLASSVQYAVSQPDPITRDEVGWVYARARFLIEFERIMEQEGRMVLPREFEHVPVASDTFALWVLKQISRGLPPEPPKPWAGEVSSWTLIPPDRRLKNRNFFKNTKMAYVGNDHFTSLDTTSTPKIRALMQQAFGAPTETIVETSLSPSVEEYIQFEYWFVVNDSIPVIVMDPNGPLDRGIVLAGGNHWRDYLYNVRQSLLGPMMHEGDYGVYVDYYYDPVTRVWYRTGFDGTRFFNERIQRPNMVRGRPEL